MQGVADRAYTDPQGFGNLPVGRPPLEVPHNFELSRTQDQRILRASRTRGCRIPI